MPHHYELPIASFLAVVLAILPLPWHWKARNVATLSIIWWLVVVNLLRGVSAIIWMDNVRIHSEWFCDITTKIAIGNIIALPACSLCITRNLAHIASARIALLTAADKRRRQVVDLCITTIPPVLLMILHYVVQGHRFDIFEDIGCQPATYFSFAALFILFIPPIVMSLCSLVYAGIALRHFLQRRAEFERFLQDSNSALNTSRYLRLMALAISEMVWGISLGIYTAVFNFTRNGFRPYTSWSSVHSDFSRIALWPSFLIPKKDLDQALLIWWITPCTAFLFFIFFGLSQEALEGYASMFRWVRRVVFRQTVPPKSNGTWTKSSSLPRFVPFNALNKSTSRPRSDSFGLGSPNSSLNKEKFEPDCLPPKYQLDDVDLETASAMSLTLPGMTLDSDSSLSSPEPAYLRHQRADSFDVVSFEDIQRPSRSFDIHPYARPDGV